MPGAVEIGNGKAEMVDQRQMVQEPVVKCVLACFSVGQGEYLHHSHCDGVS